MIQHNQHPVTSDRYPLFPSQVVNELKRIFMVTVRGSAEGTSADCLLLIAQMCGESRAQGMIAILQLVERRALRFHRVGASLIFTPGDPAHHQANNDLPS